MRQYWLLQSFLDLTLLLSAHASKNLFGRDAKVQGNVKESPPKPRVAEDEKTL